jgi:hypothetical protein
MLISVLREQTHHIERILFIYLFLFIYFFFFVIRQLWGLVYVEDMYKL